MLLERHIGLEDTGGVVAQSVMCPLHKQGSCDRSSRPAHSFVEK